MSKKKYLVILFTLLLVVLLGMFSNCYADSMRTWTESDLKNIMYNKWSTNYTDSQIETFFTNKATEIAACVLALNNNDNIYVGCNSTSNDFEISVNNSATIKPYLYSGKIQNWGSNTTTTKYRFDIRYNLADSLTGNNAVQNNAYTSNYYYTSHDIYTNSSGSTVSIARGYQPTNYFDGIYLEDKWEFLPSTSTTVTISTETNSLPSYLIDSALNVHLGIVQDSAEVQTLTLRYYKYDNGTGRFVPYGNEYNWFDYNRDGFLYKWSPGTSVNNNTYYSTDLVLYDTNNYQNNIIRLKITSLRNDLNDMYYYFYVQNNHTYISNGQVIPSLTFSGDYGNDYNQQNQDNIIQENHDDTINTITSTDGADDLINSYLSGDIDSWSSDLGYHPFENPFTSFLFNLVSNVYDSLTRRGNVVLNFNHHNSTGWVINTDDFITPEGPLKNLVRWSMIFFYLYGNYKFFHYLLTLIETAKIDKAIATLGTDEFYDSDIM